jgi:hypothetical protein
MLWSAVRPEFDSRYNVGYLGNTIRRRISNAKAFIDASGKERST